MASRGSWLFTTWSGGGNIHPLVVLGRHLVSAGHTVRVLGPVELAGRFEAEGLALVPRAPYDWAALTDLDRDARAERLESFQRTVAEEVVTEAARVPTDAVVADYMEPAALCGAELTGLPFAAFVHTLYESQAVAVPSPMQMMVSDNGLARVRVALGLPPVARVTDLLVRAPSVLVTTVPELDQPSAPVPANVHYVGPLVEEPGNDAGWQPPAAPAANSAPLVLVSLGTTDMGEAPVIGAVIEALADAPVRVVVTIGEHLDLAAFSAPPNATVTGYVRHSAVMPHARVFVTHAGMSGVGAALSVGLPMVCVPLGREQPDNAAHVARAGVGLVVAPDAVADELPAAVLTVAHERAFRTAATELAEVIAAYGNGARAVAELERLLSA
jgi:MGT family glycosyltransferase